MHTHKTIARRTWSALCSLSILAFVLAPRVVLRAQYPVLVNVDSSAEGLALADQTPLSSGRYRVGWFDGLNDSQIQSLALAGNLTALDAGFREVFSFTDVSSFGTGLPFESRTIVAAGDSANLTVYRNATSNPSNPLQSAAGEVIYAWILNDPAGVSGSPTQMAILRSSSTFGAAQAVDGHDYEANFSTASDSPGILALFGSLATVVPGGGVDLNDGSPADGLGIYGGAKVITLGEIAGTESAAISLANGTLFVPESAGNLLVQVVRTGSTASAVSVTHATANGTALAGTDFTTTNGTTNISGGSGSANITIPITNRAGFQGNRSFTVTISNPQAVSGNASLGAPTTANVTIVESAAPQPGQLALSSASYSVAEDGGSLNVTVQRTGGSDGTANVTLTTSNGSASGPNDYTPLNTLVAFANGETSKNISITINDDSTFEGNETFTAILSDAAFQHPGGSLAAPSSATVTIVENDAPPGSFAFGNATYSIVEGNAGTANLVIPVLRSGGAGGNVSVSFATANGSALSGSDYVAQAGSLNFANGVTAANLTIVVNGDTAFEGDETFTVSLSNPTGGSSLGAPANTTVTIQDDDPAPPNGSLQFSSANYSVVEGNTTATITVTRTDGSFGNITVDYTATNGTASDGSDFTVASGTLAFAHGQTSRNFTVTIKDDLVFEGDETVLLALSNPAGGAALGQPQNSVLTIAENDEPGRFRFSAANYSMAEGGGNFTVTVQRVGGSDGTVAVNYTTADGTAQAGTHYVATSGTLVFGHTETEKTFQIQALDDDQFGPDRTVLLGLSNPTGGAELDSPAEAVLTLTNDETPGNFRFAVANFTASENAGTATITVNRTGGSDGVATVNFATADGTGVAGTDYEAANGTLSFAHGETSKTFTVTILDNPLFNPNRTVLLMLSDPSDGSTVVAPADATLTILENEVPQFGVLSLTTDAFSAPENIGNTTVVVQRTGGSDGEVSVKFETTNGTALAGSDFVGTNGTLVFAQGETSKSFTVQILDDSGLEPDETVNVRIFDPTGGATLGSPSQGVLTILNDDLPARFRLSQASYNGTEGSTANIVVTRENALDQTIVVRIVTENGSARSGQDFKGVARNLTFDPNETQKTVPIAIYDDAAPEAQESFAVRLSNPSAGSGGKKKKKKKNPAAATTASIEIRQPNPATVFISRSDAIEQPDMQAAPPKTSAFVGNDLYNADGSNQIAVANLARGSTASFSMRIQNDGTATDSFLLKGTTSYSPKFTATYRADGKDITEEMVAGTYRVANVAPGSHRTITVEIKAASGASLYDGTNVGITATSENTTSKTDTARAAAIVTR